MMAGKDYVVMDLSPVLWLRYMVVLAAITMSPFLVMALDALETSMLSGKGPTGFSMFKSNAFEISEEDTSVEAKHISIEDLTIEWTTTGKHIEDIRWIVKL